MFSATALHASLRSLSVKTSLICSRTLVWRTRPWSAPGKANGTRLGIAYAAGVLARLNNCAGRPSGLQLNISFTAQWITNSDTVPIIILLPLPRSLMLTMLEMFGSATSTTRVVSLIGSGAVSWSTTEADFIAGESRTWDMASFSGQRIFAHLNPK